MELSLESVGGALSAFQPKTGALEEWNDAYVRVEDYLRAHRIHNRLHQSRLILRILERAARRHEQYPNLSPTTLAAEEAERMMDAWFGEILGEQNLPPDRIAIAGRLASSRPSPRPRSGKGKTTTTVGLGQAFAHLGKRATIAIRQPSMGPTLASRAVRRGAASARSSRWNCQPPPHGRLPRGDCGPQPARGRGGQSPLPGKRARA